MLLLGIVGHPVSHSKSPKMHQAALDALGIEGTYLRFDVRPERVREAVLGLRALGIRGVNVTVPHKQAVMGALDVVSDDARAIGAVNTIVCEGGRLVGSNTDAPGLVRSLGEADVPLQGARVVVLGAGGAARAAVVGLARAGAARVDVVARRRDQADALVSSLGALPVTPTAHALDALQARVSDATLLVQSTSATLGVTAEAEAFARALPLEAMPAGAHVVDLVYQPLETTVLARARALGLVPVDGLGMLLHQGALAFEAFTGQRPPLEVMRAALMR